MRINRSTRVTDPDTGERVLIPAGEVPDRYAALISNPLIKVDERQEQSDRSRRTRLEEDAERFGIPGWARMSLEDLDTAVRRQRAARTGSAFEARVEQVTDDKPGSDPLAPGNDDPVDARVQQLVDAYDRDALVEMAKARGVEHPGNAKKAEIAAALVDDVDAQHAPSE